MNLAPVNQRLATLIAGQLVEEQNLARVATSVANAHTPGFKGAILKPKSELWAQDRPVLYPVPDQTVYDQRPGGCQHTENPYHVALTSSGYFAVQTPQGIRYTRDGTFSLNAQNQLVNSAGHLVLSRDKNPLHLGEGRLHITNDGALSLNGKSLSTELGVFDLKDPEEAGQNLFSAEEDPNNKPSADIHMVQGALENSNVSIIEESMHLMILHRHFEQMQNMIEELGKIDDRVININAKS